MPTPRRRILILFAHPAIQKSRVNRQLMEAVRGLDGVTFHDLYEHYPELDIEIDREQALLRNHDVVLLQHPFYWYSVPAIIKEWMDLVLEYGFAYGERGDVLHGKPWVHVLTTGGPTEAYHRTGHNRFTIRELLAPLVQTAHLCGMPFLPPLAIHAAHRLDREQAIPAAAARYRKFVEFLRDADVDLAQFAEAEHIPFESEATK